MTAVICVKSTSESLGNPNLTAISSAEAPTAVISILRYSFCNLSISPLNSCISLADMFKRAPKYSNCCEAFTEALVDSRILLKRSYPIIPAVIDAALVSMFFKRPAFCSTFLKAEPVWSCPFILINISCAEAIIYSLKKKYNKNNKICKKKIRFVVCYSPFPQLAVLHGLFAEYVS